MGWATLVITVLQELPTILDLIDGFREPGSAKKLRAVDAIRKRERDVIDTPELSQTRSALIDAQVAYANALERQVAGR